ncbi:LOW QUALITY PROTEIN: fungal-specific transcription factor domain-containing protein [Colletotrichum navitas]|uniref:Fungal-specific transcription factor domain-containing protein n=1 Tax=Colletotrichum navitas TaxID=681940 RepID=A0AAD8V1Z5_9PEZI|nr:LOW QUALITY PROTEIN: fungal-specific transcription factor domain-containing protein [Colletotrichum navitas]KAK1579189.1 LOW QUALITY PROTEIN: fungal-specific transcription factor domain-containing protein [Colletotrichum navitas]
MAFAADQACKECRRRKAKCDRALPTCNLCVKYRRHCLYEKHARTPLTRKHLTEVEERLERAEALITHMRALMPAHARPISSMTRQRKSDASAPKDDCSFDFSRPALIDSPFHADTVPPEPGIVPHIEDGGERQPQLPETPLGVPPGHLSSSTSHSDSNLDHTRAYRTTRHHRQPVNDATHRDINLLEAHPTDDFEWDEQDTLTNYSASPESTLESPLTTQLDLNRHITDAMVDAYFRLYHVSYPILHEATFRAQYAGVIPRPCGDCWLILAYTVAAIGVYTTATNLDNMDMHLFAQARSILSFNFLEVGNLTLVQALTLISNYQQKRDKPNSGYNYLGLAVRMAMGLGLHKEFQGWNISPLNMEIRRRVWWSLCVFDVGATITFSRPSVWPCEGVEVSLPLNVDDKSLTAISKSYPAETQDITPYTAVRTQASFHMATTPIYTRVISKPLPTANEMLKLDQDLLEPWRTGVPSYFSETATVPPKYVLAHAVMNWRCRNLRVIMYRPFVIRRALQARDRILDDSPDNVQAFEKCLADAKATIASISGFWERNEKNRLSAWYALYFLFQAALIPCICLRNDPNSSNAADWREQVTTTIRCIIALAPVNSSSPRCYQVIMDLCGRFLNDDAAAARVLVAHPQIQTAATPGYEPNTVPIGTPEPIDESPQTQINSVLSMMWPNVPPMEAADVVMGDDAWMEFLKSGTSGDGDGAWFGS